MSALEVTSDTRVFKINNEDRFFRTITTHENGEIQKTVYQQTIDKDTYDKASDSSLGKYFFLKSTNLNWRCHAENFEYKHAYV